MQQKVTQNRNHYENNMSNKQNYEIQMAGSCSFKLPTKQNYEMEMTGAYSIKWCNFIIVLRTTLQFSSSEREWTEVAPIVRAEHTAVTQRIGAAWSQGWMFTLGVRGCRFESHQKWWGFFLLNPPPINSPESLGQGTKHQCALLHMLQIIYI